MDTSALNYSMLGLTIATVVFAAASLWAGVHYGRKAFRESKKANEMASERSIVKWQIERTNESRAGEFLCGNVGHDTAYDVMVLAWTAEEKTQVTAAVVPPALEKTDPKCPPWVEFLLPERQKNGPGPVTEPPVLTPLPPEKGDRYPFPVDPMETFVRQQQEKMREQFREAAEEEERQQVWVSITWRSEKGRWSTEEMQTG